MNLERKRRRESRTDSKTHWLKQQHEKDMQDKKGEYERICQTTKKVV